jgi:leucyl-tRNA synthetase
VSTAKVYSVAVGTDERALAAAAVMERLLGAGGSAAIEFTGEASSAIRNLRSRGLISMYEVGDGSGTSLRYAPSSSAKRTIADDGNGHWGPKVQKYWSQTVKAIPGALFDLPLINGDGCLQAFITDWSPFPAACAVAVHPSHPLADAMGNRANQPTGEYVRHPLHGDMLPVWTADWVKPEFGTGTVIINPAHSDVDLEFAQAVGLPVRFGLAPSPPTSDENSWPTPPVVNVGVAVRTGIADGEPAAVARKKYLDLLVESGRGRSHTDRLLGTIELSQASESELSALKRDENVRLNVVSALAELLSCPVQEGSVFVVGHQRIDELLRARALHIDLHGTDIMNPQIITLGSWQWQAGQDLRDDVRKLALISVAKNDDVASVKKQNVELVSRFFEVHQELVDSYTASVAVEGAKRITSVMSFLADGAFSMAFSELYKLQRDLRKSPESLSSGDREGYFVAAFVLGNASLPAGHETDGVLSSLRR